MIPTPWLPWSPIGEIRYDDPQSALCVHADVYESRAGWTWAAVVTPYVVQTEAPTSDAFYDPGLVKGRPIASGTQRAGSEAEAKAACEAWIVAAAGRADRGGA